MHGQSTAVCTIILAGGASCPIVGALGALPMTFAPTLSWELVVALVALLVLAVVASRVGHVGIERDVVVATVAHGSAAGDRRADHRRGPPADAGRRCCSRVVMFSVAVGDGRRASARPADRVAVDRRRPRPAAWCPCSTIIFALQAAVVHRAGDHRHLRHHHRRGDDRAHADGPPGLRRHARRARSGRRRASPSGCSGRAAISLVIGRHAREAVLPAIDQTRTVGLLTLSGVFVGVLLGVG